MIDITNEDHTLIKSHIILPRVLTAFERDIALIKATLKTLGPYVDAIAEAQRKLTADIYEVRKGFRQRGIKVYEEVTDGGGGWRVDAEVSRAEY
ncbi:hypothetical protein [Paenibacillus sp. 2KB_22]|uniref:hypothetical protein n=1 Tax=Paenibacillus sp. 2KB_22 TaxID=3232978 RepID=UPI003F9A1023